MTATKDRKALAAKHPDSWVPVHPGDVLEGEIVDVREAWSDVRAGGSFYPLLVVKTADGETRNVHGFPTVLFNEIMRWRPAPGERVVIEYVGPSKREPRPGQNPPTLYRFTVAGRDPAALAESIYDSLAGGGGKTRPSVEQLAANADEQPANADVPF